MVVVTVAVGMLLLGLTAARLDLLVVALRELGPLLEAPPGAELWDDGGLPSMRRKDVSSAKVRATESSSPAKSKTASREAAKATGFEGLRVQSAMRPRFSERENGTKGMKADATGAFGGP